MAEVLVNDLEKTMPFHFAMVGAWMAAWFVAIPTVVAASGGASEAAFAASPGESARFARIEARCPTFSWGAIDGSAGYEIELFAVGPDPAHDQDRVRPLTRRRLPAGVTTWTGSGELCPTAGRYGWHVRAAGVEGGWSAPLWFEVETLPTRRLRSLIETLEQVDHDRRSRAALRRGSGSRRLETVEERERVASAGGTPISLQVDGLLAASGFSGNGGSLTQTVVGDVVCEACVGGFDYGQGTMGTDEIFDGAVTGAHVLDGTITTQDYAVGGVDSDSIADGAILTQHIAPSAVGSTAIADGSLGRSKISAIRAVAVECDGECSDGDVETTCSLAGNGWSFFGMTAAHSINDAPLLTLPCGGDNECRNEPASGWVCADGSGWDCLVFCMK